MHWQGKLGTCWVHVLQQAAWQLLGSYTQHGESCVQELTHQGLHCGWGCQLMLTASSFPLKAHAQKLIISAGKSLDFSLDCTHPAWHQVVLSEISLQSPE